MSPQTLESSGILKFRRALLRASWVVISRVLSRVTMLIIHIRGLITQLITSLTNP